MSMNPLRRRSQDAPTTKDEVHDGTRTVTREEVVTTHSGRDGDTTVTREHSAPPTGPVPIDRTAHDTQVDSHDLPPDQMTGADRARAHAREHQARRAAYAEGRRDEHDDRDDVRHDDVGRDGRHDDARHDDTREHARLDRAAVLAREKDAFGGVKIGSAFFGWLTAVGTAVLLTALVAAVTTAVRVASGRPATTDPSTIAAGTGLRTDIAIIVILFLAYYCGGYVAGRMARFNGLKQGLAVWVWAIVAALVIAAAGALVGARWDLLSTLNGFPRLQAAETTVTGAGVVTTLIALAAALVGAMLGGLAGMRFHRRVDRAGFGR